MNAYPLTMDGLKADLIAKIQMTATNDFEALVKLKDHIATLKKEGTTLHLEALDYKSVIRMCGITENNDFRFLNVTARFDPPMPPELTTKLNEIRAAVSEDLQGELFLDYHLQAIMLTSVVLAGENLRSSGQEYPQFILEPNTRIQDCVALNDGGSRRITGKASYTVRLADGKDTDILLVIMQSKARGVTDIQDGSLVAYMSLIQKLRRAEGTASSRSILYGITTDGRDFRFWSLNDTSRLTRTRLYEWRAGDAPKIVGYLRWMIHWAVSCRNPPESLSRSIEFDSAEAPRHTGRDTRNDAIIGWSGKGALEDRVTPASSYGEKKYGRNVPKSKHPWPQSFSGMLLPGQCHKRKADDLDDDVTGTPKKKYAYSKKASDKQTDVLSKFEKFLGSLPDQKQALALPVNMTYKTAMQIFGLKEESVHKFLTLTHKFYDEVPQSLSANLKDIEQAFSGAHHEKLVVSYSLSAIMASSIAAELKRLDAIKKDYQEYVFEPGTIVNLCGHVPLRAAYTLRLPREGGENVLMVVMEGKRGEADSAEGTLVSFMGTVFKLRKSSGKTHNVVYGISSDGANFRFWRTSNSGGLTRTPLREWNSGGEREIVSYIRYMVHCALTYPLSGPVRDIKVEESPSRDLLAFRIQDTGTGDGRKRRIEQVSENEEVEVKMEEQKKERRGKGERKEKKSKPNRLNDD